MGLGLHQRRDGPDVSKLLVVGPLTTRNGRGVMLDHSDFSPTDRVNDIVQEILKRRSIDRAVAADDDLRQIGLTSLDMVNLMLAVEAEFDVQIPDVNMTPANFRSVSNIGAMIARLLRAE
jgi:acyl carrier protein